MPTRDAVKLEPRHARCPYCHAAVVPGDEKVACEGCMAWHHAECWTSQGACSACGSAQRMDGGTKLRACRTCGEPATVDHFYPPIRCCTEHAIAGNPARVGFNLIMAAVWGGVAAAGVLPLLFGVFALENLLRAALHQGLTVRLRRSSPTERGPRPPKG